MVVVVVVEGDDLVLGCPHVVIAVLVGWTRWIGPPSRSLWSWFGERKAAAAAVAVEAEEAVRGERGFVAMGAIL